MSARHFLSLKDCTPDELVGLIRRGMELKGLRNSGVLFEPLRNRVLGMIFEKASTRTRVSFEAGMIHCSWHWHGRRCLPGSPTATSSSTRYWRLNYF